MILELTDRDAQLLRDALHNYLPELAREASRTDDRALRHALVERQDVVEGVLERLTLATT